MSSISSVHPRQNEHFEVLSGTTAFRVDGVERLVQAGQSIDVAAGTAHTFSNAGIGEMRVVFEFRPGLDSTDRFYELQFGFAQERRVNAKALPGLLDIATCGP